MKLTTIFKKNRKPRADNVELMEWTSMEKAISAGVGQKDGNLSAARAAAVELLQTDLREMVTSLEKFTDGSEADFMLMGIGLRTVYANVSELTELMVKTVEGMSSGAQNGFLDRGREILNTSLEDIQNRQNEVKNNLGRINALVHDIENLHASSKQIKKFSQSLKTVSLNMLVENARAIDQSVNIFSDVAQEIKDLSLNIARIANDVYKNVEKAREVHSITQEEISAGINRLDALTNQIRTTVQESTHDTEDLMRFSVDTIEASGRQSREISRQVAEIVVGVQFHDNMKQRIMNIIQTLNLIQSTAKSTQAKESSGREEKKPAASIIRDQAGKLNEVNIELEEVYQKNRAALQKIGAEVNDVLQALGSMTSNDGNIRSRTLLTPDPFSHLKEALTQLHDLLNQGETFYQQIQKTADQVSDIAADLSELLSIVRSISANTHNKAINSIIAANRQGEKGGALKLLAQAMNDLATRSDGFSSEIEGIITSIMKAAEKVGRKNKEASTDLDGNSSAINSLESIINDISMEYDRFREKSLAAYERARALKKATDTTLTSLKFFKGLSRKIDEYHNRLIDMASQPGHEAILIEVDATAIGHVPGKHTAERENNITLFTKSRTTVLKDSYSHLSRESLADNVELF